MSGHLIPTYSHAIECLWEAVSVLATWDGSVQYRLYATLHQLKRLRVEELPEEYREEFRAIIDEVAPIGNVTESWHFTVNSAVMTEERAAQTAKRILSIYRSVTSEV